MKNKNLRLFSASAAAIVASSFASATVQQLDNTWYEITYSAHFEEAIYTASRPMQYVGGGSTYTGDPLTIAWHPVGPAGDPTLGSYVYSPQTPWAPVVWTPIVGHGLLNVATGEIRLDPVNWELIVVGGSYGFINWSQTLKGSFNSAHTVFSMTTFATVNDGIRMCETNGSTACVADGGPGSRPVALGVPQTFDPAVVDDDLVVITPEVPLAIHPDITFSQAVGPGATARYFFQSDKQPAFADTTIDITVGKVVYLPVPAAAWLFAPSLLGLFAGKRFRRK